MSQHIIDNLKEIKSGITTNNKPQWLKDFQDEHFSRFETLGVPTIKNEEWKYSNLAQWQRETFKAFTTADTETPAELKNYLNQDETNIVFVNGVISEGLSNFDTTDAGVTVKTLQNALTTNEIEIKCILSKYDKATETSFIALNNALIDNGTFIKITDKCVSEKLIHIVHLTTDTANNIANNIRTLISIDKSCEAHILESYISFNDDLNYFNNTLTDVFVDENSTLHYVKAQKESDKAYHISNTRVWIERNANFKGFTFTTNTGFTRNDLDIVINGEGSDGTLNSLYSMFNNQHVDNHTSVDHRVPNCTSNQLYKGILNDASHAVFNGKVFVRSIAQQTNSYQLNKNLLLGKKAHVDTKPQLEIFADDVKCTHGATIGQLEEDELFYLQTRCITRNEAIRMIARGYAEETIETIKSDAIRSKLVDLLEPSFNNFA